MRLHVQTILVNIAFIMRLAVCFWCFGSLKTDLLENFCQSEEFGKLGFSVKVWTRTFEWSTFLHGWCYIATCCFKMVLTTLGCGRIYFLKQTQKMFCLKIKKKKTVCNLRNTSRALQLYTQTPPCFKLLASCLV